MDLHDVSGVPQLVRRLQEQKQMLRDAQARKGQRAPPRAPRWALTLRFRSRSMKNAAKELGGPVQAHMTTSFVPPPYPPCVVPLCDLAKTTIDDLVLETHHRGRYLLLRCVTPQDRMAAVMAIVEDEKGDAILLQLYHQEHADEMPEDILREGLVLILKEPYLKCTADGGDGLRVDHVSDVEFLSSDDERIPDIWKQPAPEMGTATVWKLKGNEAFKKSEYRAAIEAYSRALRWSPTEEEIQTIVLNRALVHLKLKAFDAALWDVGSTSLSVSPPEKALFRKAQALYGLGRFREGIEVLQLLRSQHPSNSAAKELLDRAAGRLAEQLDGLYSFKSMYAEAAKLGPPCLDRATFVGPVTIKGSAISPGGRGLFTTKAVAAGDLLICEKAFAVAFADEGTGKADGSQRSNLAILVDTETDRMTLGAQAELLNLTIRKLYLNPSSSKVVTDLHHGAYEPMETSSVDGHPVIDSFLVRRIIALNCFGCPATSSRDDHLGDTLEASPMTGGCTPQKQFGSCGVWPTASYINHGCISSARRSFIGDMMIVRATRDMPADTELTWWYQIPPTQPTGYFTLQRSFLPTWGFTCKCGMCREARDTPESVLRRRQQLWTEFQVLLGPAHQRAKKRITQRMTNARKAEAIVTALQSTYKRPPTQAPRLGVSQCEGSLAREYLECMQPAGSARLGLEALASLGFVIGGADPQEGAEMALEVREWGLMVAEVIDCWMFLREAYRALTSPHLAVAAERHAKTAYRICYGEDETFGETYLAIPSPFGH